jgi:hypothetical protein
VQIILTDEHGVLRRLIGRQMRHQATIAERTRVAVNDQHAAGGSRQSEHFTQAAVGTGVAAKRATLVDCGGLTDSDAIATRRRPDPVSWGPVPEG